MLLRLIEAATERLARSVDEVNDLNVYPVPDGDTGTNMLHTMRSAARDARAAGQRAEEVAAAAARGALMGARGNSGVILSQVIRGLKEAAAGADTIDGDQLRSAFRRAHDLAFAAVTAPAPGTILTALDAMADVAVGTAGEAAGVLRAAV
ncbi:MAG: DAK2 domain-containing protein, partial [Candidatus Limnocylindria bacterium]